MSKKTKKNNRNKRNISSIGKLNVLNLLGFALATAILIGVIIYVVPVIKDSVFTNSVDAETRVKIETTFSSYYNSEKVVFSVSNISSKSIKLPNAAPWEITNNLGRRIYVPIAASQITKIEPGQSLKWSWDQTNNRGQKVQVGSYKILFNKTIEAKFIIDKQIGSSGYFTFKVAEDPNTVRMFFDDPQTVRYAIENYYRKNDRFPLGSLVDDRPAKSPHDDKYNWHMDQSSTRMVEVSAEYCDAVPSDVQKDIDYWVNTVKYYCPWYARVIKLQ